MHANLVAGFSLRSQGACSFFTNLLMSLLPNIALFICKCSSICFGIRCEKASFGLLIASNHSGSTACSILLQSVCLTPIYVSHLMTSCLCSPTCLAHTIVSVGSTVVGYGPGFVSTMNRLPLVKNDVYSALSMSMPTCPFDPPHFQWECSPQWPSVRSSTLLDPLHQVVH